jgi:hypothetical protein
VGPGRLELPAHGLGNRCSIHLSYGPRAILDADIPDMDSRLPVPLPFGTWLGKPLTVVRPVPVPSCPHDLVLQIRDRRRGADAGMTAAPRSATKGKKASHL